MGLPTRAGTYMARLCQWAIGTYGANNLATLFCKFDLMEFFEPDGSRSGIDQGLQIQRDFYLTQKNGELNRFTVNALKSALGWDGLSMESLANGSWGDIDVRLVLGFETHQGKSRIRVQYINSADYTGSDPIETDPQQVQSLDAKYGSQLRALAGATATANPKYESAKEAMKRAWSAFRESAPAGSNADSIGAAWKKSIAGYFGPNSERDAIAAAEWDRFTKDGFASVAPINDLDIPF